MNPGPTTPSKRPLLITFLCAIGAIGAVVAAISILRVLALTGGGSASVWLAAAALSVSVICLYGFWRMRRWAVVLLTVALLASFGHALLTDRPIILAHIAIPVLLLAAGLLYFTRMD